MYWLRSNTNRLFLGLVGAAVFVIGLAQGRIGLAIPLTVFGVAVVVLALIYPRVTSISVGLEGLKADLKAELGRIERDVKTVEGKVDALIAVGTIEAHAEVFPPTVVAEGQEAPPSEEQ